jgi:hypothetical protein
MVKRTPEQRAASLAAKRESPIAPTVKGPKPDMRLLAVAPPAPRVREHKGLRNGMKVYGRLGVNVERKEANRMATHGPHVDWVVTLPCCVCMPEHYHGPELKPFMYAEANRESRISDPHHVRTQGAGGTAETCVPLCRLHHSHMHSLGPDTFAVTYAVDLSATARLLWEHSPVRDD